MKDNKNQVRKICSFYVDDWHLTAMILPHINITIKENKEILTILENGIKNNIEELLSKINLNQKIQEQILEINWTSNFICKYSQIKREIEEKAKFASKLEIIVNGTEEYIKIANKNIEKVISSIKEKEIDIINCYEIAKYNDITKILDEHDFVLNTSGIKKIEEVFTDYNKKEEDSNGIQQKC